jgi:hypothetical protein
MATLTWISTGLGLWSTAANWSSDQVPGAGDTALFNLTGNNLIDLPGTATVGSVVLSASGTEINVAGSLNVTNGLTITAGELKVGGAVDATDLTATGTIDNTGVLTLNGTVLPSSLAEIGGSGGTLVIDGTIENQGATLDLGNLANQNVVSLGTIYQGTAADLVVGGSATLDGVTAQGTLTDTGHITILNGFSIAGPGGIGVGTIDLGSVGGFDVDGTLVFADNESLANLDLYGTGTLVADGTLTVANTATLTQVATPFDFNIPDLTFSGAGTIINSGTILGNSEDGMKNNGGDGLIAIQSTVFENFGLIEAIDSSGLVSNQSLTNPNHEGTAQIAITGSVFVNEAGATIAVQQYFGIASLTVAATTTFTNDGLITSNGPIYGGGEIDIAAPVFGSGTIGVINGGVTLESGVSSTQTILFGEGGVLFLAQPNFVPGPIENFGSGDFIELVGVTATAISYTSGDLKLQTATGTLDLGITGTHTLADFVIDNSGTETGISIASPAVPCFAAGTRIATTRGPIAVEDLHAGDSVVTASGGTQPIQWIGHRNVDCRRHPAPSRVWPVRIAAHAFAEGQPERLLLLSPDHSVFIDNVLIPVKYLVNDSTIVQAEVASISYFHIELPRHDILLAEGLPAESYLDIGDRSNFANSNEPMRLFPDFASRSHDAVAVRGALVWEALGHAPLIVSGPRLAAVKRHLQAREAVLGRRDVTASFAESTAPARAIGAVQG